MIVLFNGPPNSGKDISADLLVSELSFTKMFFKDALFTETLKHFDVTEEWFMSGYTRELKEKKETKLDGLSRREALIFVSEDIMKPEYGKDIFGKIMAEKLLPTENYCFSDSGFLEELSPIINKFEDQTIIMIQIMRDGCTYNFDSRMYLNFTDFSEHILGYKHHLDESNFSQLEKTPENLKVYRIYNNSSLHDYSSWVITTVRKELHEGKKIHTKQSV